MAFKMKNKAVMKMAKMAGDSRTAMKMKKNSPMKDNGFKTEKLKQVDLVGKRTKKQKFTKAIQEKYPSMKDMKAGTLYRTGKGDFKKKKDGSIVRRDDAGRGFSSGGGFVNRLKKEGLGSALANTFPARVVRSMGRPETKHGN